jgi:hypothetical protein
LSGAQSADYIVSAAASGAIGAISPAALTATLTGSTTKTYDSTTTANVTAANYALSGLFAGDAVNVAQTSADYAGKDVGSGLVVTASGLSLTGAQAGDYIVNGSASGAIGVITPASLSAGLIGSTSKVYDAALNANLDGSNFNLTGTFAGDAVTLVSPASGLYAGKDVGSNLSVTASGLTLSGAQAGDYVVNASAAGAIGAITPANLTASLTGATTKTYDATAAAGLTPSNYSLAGLFAGDSIAVIQGSANYASKDVGANIAVTANGLTLSGAQAGDYTVNASASGAIGTITPASLTATLIGSTTKIYNGTTIAALTPANYALSGVLGGDSVALNDPAVGAYAAKNAGSGLTVTATGLALTGAQAGDYTVNAAASGAIGAIAKANLSASLNGSASKIYDATTTAHLTTANYSLSGLVAGDLVGVTQTAGTYASKNVGTNIALTATGIALSGSDAGNYTVNSSSHGVGVITRAHLTVSLIGSTAKVYNGTTAAALATANYTLGGLYAGDVVAYNKPTNGVFAGKDVANGIVVTASGLVLTGAQAGNYSLGSTATGAIGSITPATLTATLIGATTKVYDGTTAASLKAANYKLSGTVYGTDVVGLNNPATGIYASKNVGTGIVVTASGLALTGTQAKDYKVNTSASAAIGAITARPITVTADNLSKFFGQQDPLFTYKITLGSLVAGESLTGNLTRVPGSGFGNYAILRGTLAASSNYSMTFFSGVFTIKHP